MLNSWPNAIAWCVTVICGTIGFVALLDRNKPNPTHCAECGKKFQQIQDEYFQGERL